MTEEILEQPPQDGGQEPASSYVLPDEYKEAGWAQAAPQFTQAEEAVSWLAKRYNDQNQYVGGKVDEYVKEQGFTKVPDFNNTEEAKEFLSRYVPQEEDAYNIAKMYDGDEAFSIKEETANVLSEAFRNAKVLPQQAKEILDAYREYETKEYSKLVDPEDFTNRMKSIYGNDYEKAKEPIDNIIKSTLSEEEIEIINKKMPNEVAEMVHKIAKGVYDKMGYSESSRGANNPDSITVMSAEEKEKRYDELHEKLRNLNNVTHKQEDKDKILAELQSLFK